MKKVGKEERQKFIENAAYEQKVLDKLDEFFKERKAGVTQIFQIHSSVKDYINIDSTKSKFNKFEGGQSWSEGDFGKILNDLYSYKCSIYHKILFYAKLHKTMRL